VLDGPKVVAIQTGPENWGLAVRNAGMASATQPHPVRIEIWRKADDVREHACGYTSVMRTSIGFRGTAELALPDGVRFAVEDHWLRRGPTLLLVRKVTVFGDALGGFLSAMTFPCDRPASWLDVEPFAPGMIYGRGDQIRDVAIGGSANYQSGVRHVRIREDRLPAPLFGLRWDDGWALSVSNPTPDATTTAAESLDVTAEPRIDARFRFAALGGYEQDGHVAAGFWFPGTEGEITYRGDIFPAGQLHRWRRCYHPIADGLVQQYAVEFQWSQHARFDAYYTAAWRRAWNTLEPAAAHYDIALVRHSLVAMLADQVICVDGKAGIPIICDAVTGQSVARDRRALMGFCGRNTDAAYFLLCEAARHGAEQAARFHRLGVAILDSFAAIGIAPPQAEGFDLDTGSLTASRYRDQPHGLIHLRALVEGCKSMLRAWKVEREQGCDHPHWLRWCLNFADWLLEQQQPDGGFPRGWKVGTDEPGEESPKTSYNAIPFLALLHTVTAERRYLDAALRTGEFCWAGGHEQSHFVGGTLDNPNVVDKEAGTLSLEAYLALYEATGDARWLQRAVAAGNFAETWIYCWDVPMPEDDDDTALHWKKGVATTGLQLICTGHTLVDAYMAFDVASYAKLYRYTRDAHYRDVARILLHNTKNMLALPGRTYDLAGPGWQQEHWSFAPRRGYGMHRYWLPWVSISHLEGIRALEEFDPDLFAELSQPPIED
jgi:hypothetical protein